MKQKYDIRGFEGLYHTNELGQIVNSKTGRVLIQAKAKNGYCVVSLRKNGHSFTKSVHIIVFEAVYRRLLPNEDCHHINSIRSDNRPVNLVGKDASLHESEHLKGNKRRLGKKHSQQTKQKMSELRKGRIVSQQTRKRISQAKKGQKYKKNEKSFENM